MKKLIALALAASASLAAVAPMAPADAAQGCGPRFHRGSHGRCIPNYGYRGGHTTLVVGNFYHGRGYWDGRRYYQNRYRYHGGWRYR